MLLPRNVARILAELTPDDKVLEVGGWWQPFNRADYVVDLLPWETRGNGGSRGDGPERFNRDTWVLHDLNRPLPFHDDQFDFAVCSHTLEDMRDPILLCRELQRVAKRGYLECPSRRIEQVWGLEGRFVGYYHHRWLVEMEGDTVTFRFKPHLIHHSRKYHFPSKYARRFTEEETVTSMFWDGSFRFREVVSISRIRVEAELADFVRRHMGSRRYRRWTRRESLHELSRVLRRNRAVRRLFGRSPLENRDRFFDFWRAVPDIDSS